MSGNGIDDIYASTMIRSQETAAPLAEALDMWPLDPSHILSGLNEIDAGIFETALQTGISQIDAALTQFPVAVLDQVVSAFGGSI
jgi:broad specificity phosphatase PhoE